MHDDALANNVLRRKSGYAYPAATSRSKSPPNASKPDCRDWIRGKCDRGDQCRFAHDTAKQGTDALVTPTNPPSRPPTGSSVNSAQGNNPRIRSGTPTPGTFAAYQPEAATNNDEDFPSTGTAPNGERDRPPCAFFYRNACSLGPQCRNWHPPDCPRASKTGFCEAYTRHRCNYMHPSNRDLIIRQLLLLFAT